MATETISWNSIVGGNSAPLPTGNVDTGEVIASLSPNPGSVGSVTVDTTATNPNHTPGNPNNSMLSMTGDHTSPTILQVDFSDDTSSAGNYGAYDATFGIEDIDSGSAGGGYHDQIILKAFDINGNPLTISVTSNSNYNVITNPDGSVLIDSNYNTNSWNDPNSFAQVTVNGGPIASISVEFVNSGISGSHNIMLSNITYQTNPICFVTGTLIETDRGDVAVEDLMVGDLVQTVDHGYQEIRWIGTNVLSGKSLNSAPELRPICISAGALGQNTPEHDLYVSPQHRILVRSRIAEKMFGSNEVLVAAKQLVILEGIDYCDHPQGVSYVHFLFNQHEVVFANGAKAESLFTGPQALKTVGSAARQEIFTLFPELMDMDYKPTPARELATGRMGRRLAYRHAQNNKLLVN